MSRTRLKVFGAIGSKRLLMTEMVVTNTNAAASLYIVFQHSIGMTHDQVNIAQAVFTIVLIVFTFPSGWFADRFSRKWSNAGGDFAVGLGYLLYSAVSSFTQVLLVEIFIGLGHAFSKGADSSLLKSYVDETDPGLDKTKPKPKRKQRSRLEKARWWIGILTPATQAGMITIGSYYGRTDYSHMFYVTAIPFFVGGILSIFMKESGDKEEMPKPKPTDDVLTFARRILTQVREYTASALKDMWKVSRGIVADDAALRWLMIAHSLGFKLFLPVALTYGPLLLSIGASLWDITLAYILRYAAKTIGALVVEAIRPRHPPWVRFTPPSIVLLTGLGIMVAHQSITWITIAIVLIGLSEGWYDVVTDSWVNDRAAKDVAAQVNAFGTLMVNKKTVLASVNSVADTMSQVLYASILIGAAVLVGDSLRGVIVIVFVVGLVAIPVTIWRLRRHLPDGV